MLYSPYNPIAEAEGFLVACEGLTPEEAALKARDEFILGELTQRTMLRICDKVGHKIVDESYGNPDSGAISMYCRRCGWSHHVTLY